MNAEERYTTLTQRLIEGHATSVTEGKGFGSTGQLKIEGRIFAMLVRDELVLKLSRERVDELVARGEGLHFDAGKGKPMREWFVLSASSKKDWLALATEALEFVRSTR